MVIITPRNEHMKRLYIGDTLNKLGVALYILGNLAIVPICSYLNIIQAIVPIRQL